MAIRLYVTSYHVDIYMECAMYEVLTTNLYINKLVIPNNIINSIHRSLLTQIDYDLFNSRAINATI